MKKFPRQPYFFSPFSIGLVSGEVFQIFFVFVCLFSLLEGLFLPYLKMTYMYHRD